MPYTSKLIYVTLDGRECMAFFIVCICMLIVSILCVGTVVDRDILASILYLGETAIAIAQRYIFMHTRYDRDVT